MYAVDYRTPDQLPMLPDLIDFLTKPRKKAAVRRTVNSLTLMMIGETATSHAVGFNECRDICNVGGYNIMMYLDPQRVHPSLTEGVTFGGELPAHVVVAISRATLHLCLIRESFKPNWDGTASLISATPLADIDVPVIEDVRGVLRTDINFYKRLRNVRLGLYAVDFPNYGARPSREELTELIRLGMPCYYRRGWNDAMRTHTLTEEEAVRMLPDYQYRGKEKELAFGTEEELPCLEFNDMSRQ